MIRNIEKLHFIFDKTKKLVNTKLKIIKSYKNYNPEKADVIIVLGGDGFMLQVLKKYKKYNKPFYGINGGSYGFLMNKYKIKNIINNIKKSKPITISPLEMRVVTKNNKKRTAIAINEVSLLRQSRQTSSLVIAIGKKTLIKKLTCDGVLVSTPAGSTAYNFSAHGPILSLDSKKLAITPISPFRPRKWRSKIISDNSLIKIKNLNIKKRPVSVVADNIEVRNIKSVNIRVNKKIKFKLLYDKNYSLTKKIKLEQKRIKKINSI